MSPLEIGNDGKAQDSGGGGDDDSRCKGSRRGKC